MSVICEKRESVAALRANRRWNTSEEETGDEVGRHAGWMGAGFGDKRENAHMNRADKPQRGWKPQQRAEADRGTVDALIKRAEKQRKPKPCILSSQRARIIESQVSYFTCNQCLVCSTGMLRY